ncbi:MAG: 1-acyl-sn-glycerol-3-phosphate acyltransferase [Tannerella sp.]|jgi:1-acyl-sn-glycerol-3-phosphate acyltransferase|nr:1-acyl-sn-glycerol-3-phosphate acyltransferase [Tannerella sp.]
MARFFYVVYTWLVFMPLFVILTILTALLTIAGCLLGGERFFSYYPGMLWSRLTCYLALCPVKVRGREHISKGQSYVFVANHQGAFDIFLIYGFLGVPIKWMMKAGLEKLPFVGAACRAAGFIFVDNSSPAAAARSVHEAERATKEKAASLCIFPEGSRSKNGRMGRFKKGAFQIALDQRLPLVPITLNGPYHILQMGSLNLHRHRMEMLIHPPLSTEGLEAGPRTLVSLAEQTKEVIASGLWEEFRTS